MTRIDLNGKGYVRFFGLDHGGDAAFTTNGRKFEWVAELTDEHAQRIANEFSRVTFPGSVLHESGVG